MSSGGDARPVGRAKARQYVLKAEEFSGAASRRNAEIDAGTAELIPGDQVFAEARARLK